MSEPLVLSPPVVNDDFAAYHGDCIEVIRSFPDDSVHLTVSSPPFPMMYVYNNTDHDIGNCKSTGEMLEHFRFLVREMLRVTMPGRSCCIHLTQTNAFKNREGYVGRLDFRGDVIRLFQEEDWIYASEVLIDKALAHGTPVLTPDGWRPIESIEVGSSVIGGDGKATRVNAVHRLGIRPLYEVAFADGQTVRCDGGHLWTVETLAGRQNGTGTVDRTTEEMYIEGTHTPSGKPRYSTPMLPPVEFDSEPMGIDPYLLGVLLADGSLTGRSVSFCTDRESADKISLPERHRIRQYAGTEKAGGSVAVFSVASDGVRGNEVMDELRRMGIYGKRAWEKYIPESALRASIADRRQLLRGLLDCDGSASLRGRVNYCSTSRQLADDVAELVKSLGGIAIVRAEAGGKYIHNGETRQGREKYHVGISMPPDWCPFSLARKAARWKERSRSLRRTIVSIKPVESGEATCITVANPDGLFAIDGFIVTHNCPQIRAQRSKDRGLLFKSLANDSSVMSPVMCDYILIFRKKGENTIPIRAGRSDLYDNPEGWITQEEWIEWAAGVWYRRVKGEKDGLSRCDECDDDVEIVEVDEGTMLDDFGRRYAMQNHPSRFQSAIGIKEANVLNVRIAKDEKDERHLCPLQLDVIERCIKLWSAPGEIVLDPFGGIGSTAYQAIKLRRRGIFAELKQSYFDQAVRNCQTARQTRHGQRTIFDAIRESEEAEAAGVEA